MIDKIEEIRARYAGYSLENFGNAHLGNEDRGWLLAEVDKLRAENERLRAERDALRDAAREYLTTLGGAMAHFVRQAMQKLDSLVFDREGPRPAGLEKLHEPLKRPS
jgi:hypothetical protein